MFDHSRVYLSLTMRLTYTGQPYVCGLKFESWELSRKAGSRGPHSAVLNSVWQAKALDPNINKQLSSYLPATVKFRCHCTSAYSARFYIILSTSHARIRRRQQL